MPDTPARPAYVVMQGPTLLHGLNRAMLIEDLATWAWGPEPGRFGLVVAERWLAEKGFITPNPEDHDA